MVGRLIVALALIASTARADNAKLAQAREALDQVRYKQAQPLLVEALQQGTSDPVTLIEIYRLLASTATVLGQRDVAELYYRRWLALAPNAKLPDDVAPKLREPFVAAQVYMAARARLLASARLKGGEIEVYVESDPLAMVATVAADGGTPAKLGVDRRARLPATPGATAATVALLDEFGNHLVELSASTEDVVAVPPAPLRETPEPEPLVRRPVVWVVPAVAFAATGIGFEIAARSAQNDLDDIIAHSNGHFYADAQAAKDRRDRDALAADVAFAAGGACAVAAVVLYMIRPSRAHLAASPGGAAIAVAW
jgi:hypothetical protein